jgi:hypothetical protein
VGILVFPFAAAEQQMHSLAGQATVGVEMVVVVAACQLELAPCPQPCQHESLVEEAPVAVGVLRVEEVAWLFEKQCLLHSGSVAE